jgi:hypothetical protein
MISNSPMKPDFESVVGLGCRFRVSIVTKRWASGRSGIRNMEWFMTNSKPSRRDDMDRPSNEPRPREGIDIPFGPPPEEYLYRCPVCGAEDLVNEAIIDVAVGAAKFRGEYQGGMPKLGCPGCNGETMEYVDQEE